MVQLNRYSGVTVLEAEQVINAPLETVWDFFSSPHNLGRITPPEMNFIITGTDYNKKSYAGQIITYSISPFRGIRVNWATEITHLDEYKFFTDEQKLGPYKFWHHRHMFRKEGNNTIMNDIVTFKVPGGYFGNLIGRIIVEPRVLKIFRYRSEKIVEIFPDSKSDAIGIQNIPS
jgi:ligand-binding SRPBCC domain-containing protein